MEMLAIILTTLIVLLKLVNAISVTLIAQLKNTAEDAILLH